MIAPSADAVDRRPHCLYLHVPFCVTKCPYCDFNSHVGMEHLFASYGEALTVEIRRWGEELGHPRLDTVFIGGGTPSRVPAEQIAAALDAVRASFELAPDAEVTLEANPQSAEAVKMDAWLRAGVNRLSLGFQSLDPSALRFLERAHDGREAVEVFQSARAAGFGNINCDLIFAIPGSSTETWREVLHTVIGLGPDHVSAYELTPEAGTRLGADVASGRTLMPDEDLKVEQYQVAEAALGAAGLHRYEVSNWARPGRECRHNLAYWSGVPYAAAGAGAHAYLLSPHRPSWLPSGDGVGVRQWNLANPAAYIQAVRANGHAVAGHEWLDMPTTLSDLMMMGLRADRGVDLEAAGELLGADIEGALRARVDDLVATGLLSRSGGSVAATSRGRFLLNTVAAAFLP
jgi:oxygen-independent coproporphyrinogen-3 oxidase